MDKEQFMQDMYEDSLDSTKLDRALAKDSLTKLYRTMGWGDPHVLWATSPMAGAWLAGMMVYLETAETIHATEVDIYQGPDPYPYIPHEQTTAQGIWETLVGAADVLQDLQGNKEVHWSGEPGRVSFKSDTSIRRIAWYLTQIAANHMQAGGEEKYVADLVLATCHPADGDHSPWVDIMGNLADASWEYMYGKHDMSWLGHYIYEMRYLDRKLSDDLLALITASQNSGWWIAMQDFVVACERHDYIHLDANGRLHNETGPTVQYPDGWAVHAWHNTRIPPEKAWIIENSDRITPQDILNESNAELARIMLEKIGYERFVSETDADLVDEHPRWGKLWRVPMPSDRDLRHEQAFVAEVINATPEPDGSFKRYFMPINPELYEGEAGRNIHAAVASTWRKGGDNARPYYDDYRNYNPAQES